MIALLFTAAMIASPVSAADKYRAGLESRADAVEARLHFLLAAEEFERAWNAGERTAEIARNMAQSRFLAGDLGRAIRDYRRGLRMAPHDRELQQGLNAVREQAADRASSLVPNEAQSLPVRGVSWYRLAWGAIALSAIGWFNLVRGWKASRRGLLGVGLGTILVASAIGGWLGCEDYRLRLHWAEPTAVVVSATDLRSGNSEEYPRRLDVRLPAGTELRVLGERGGWLQVELPDGTPGWMSSSFVVEVD
ncbi:MAG: SH3 domain-containing protein [Gemmataceae bacterium]|nr:SH3 domain-containing protein [Gemmataceae bacterium]